MFNNVERVGGIPLYSSFNGESLPASLKKKKEKKDVLLHFSSLGAQPHSEKLSVQVACWLVPRAGAALNFGLSSGRLDQ